MTYTKEIYQLMGYQSQHGEDRIIEHLLGYPKTPGSYIDVGANHPSLDNVTKYFYDRGWHGINVEPLPHLYAALEKERPRDINLAYAIDVQVDTRPFHVQPTPEGGLSTFVDSYTQPGWVTISVDTVPLATICDIYAFPGDRRFDFVKIDVEGWERQVLQSNDWTKYRPTVVCIESTIPNSTTPCHQDWEPILIEAGYQCVKTDVANRYYMENS
jgi:FkbM family methyltransferase